MKHYLILLGLSLIVACDPSAQKLVEVKVELAPLPPPPPIEPNDPPMDTIQTRADEEATDEDAMATYFVVIADTSQSYADLHTQMYSLNQSLQIQIDTMGRYYNATKNKIVLPDTDEDEIYAGDYFPRRFPSETLRSCLS